MKICVFYPHSLYSAWSVSEGLVDTLRHMGHEPIACPIDPNTKSLSRSKYPSLEIINSCDGVLVSGPEHINNPAWKKDFIGKLYPEWSSLKVPRVAWLHETLYRDDYHELPLKSFRSNYDTIFTPAAQDEREGLRWLPFGCDTEMFHADCGDERKHGAVFVGLPYGKRAEFVNAHKLQDIIKFGKCEVTDLDGVNVRKSCELYAGTLRDSKVLVNLPSLCRHSVTKIFEGPACGAVIVTHKVEDERNHVLKSAVYYETGDELRERINALLSDEELLCRFSTLQYEEIQANHRLDQRLEVILEAMR